MGHSLGAAAILLFAADHNPNKIVLVSPFTSLRDMACRMVGKPLCYLAKHNYDNRARLKEVVEKKPVPEIYIIHGSRDEVIPVTMGRELGEEFSAVVQYQEIPNSSHNTIFMLAEDQIFTAMSK